MNNENMNQGLGINQSTNNLNVNPAMQTNGNIGGIPTVPIVGEPSQPFEQKTVTFSNETATQPAMNTQANVNANILNVQPISDIATTANQNNVTTPNSVFTSENSVASQFANSNATTPSALSFELPAIGSNNGLLESQNVSQEQTNSMPTPVISENNQNMVPTTSNEANVTTVGKYLGYMFLFAIPIIGFIMLLVTAFGKKEKSISNFAKAYLLFSLIMGALIIILAMLFASIIVQMVNSMPA